MAFKGLANVETKPLLIAVAPNGARRTQADHPKLPLSPLELAKASAQCCEAGASMLHLHVRNEDNSHSLSPEHYRAAIKEIEQAVGDKMLIQVTSEAAGIYQPKEQMNAIQELQPRCVSIGLREIIKDQSNIDDGAIFLSGLVSNGCLIQYILYSHEDIEWYQTLCHSGVIPKKNKFVLLVLGRYGKQQYQVDDLHNYLTAWQQASDWMVCAFGIEETTIMRQAVNLGGHTRVGFENNLWLPDGALAPDNAALVTLTRDFAQQQGRKIATAADAIALFA